MPRDLADGEVAHIQGSAAEPYEIKNTGGVYSCTCPAWRNQSFGIEKRTCKHIKKLRGEAAEVKRVGEAATKTAVKKKKDNPDEPPVLLAQSWEPHVDVTGWWLSEKLDGVRAYWDGGRFLSRLGNEFHAPDWFVDSLPKTALDGELWIGRGEFQRTVSVVRRQDRSKHWKDVSFVVFDAPDHGGVFEERVAWLTEHVGERDHPHASMLPHEECEGTDHLRRRLTEVEALGGEGIMARKPRSKYVAGRSHTLLKVKSFVDAEALVIEHLAGAGRHQGRLGALRAKLPDGTLFSIGTGFSDAERESPPPVGSVVTFRYQELTKDGVPRFPAFMRIRKDVDWKDAPARKKGAKKTPKRAAATPVEVKESASAPAAGAATRYFELVDDKSKKFWEITVSSAAHTVRYGRIGSRGQSKTKSFADAAAAKADADELVKSKVAKGYVEKTA